MMTKLGQLGALVAGTVLATGCAASEGGSGSDEPDEPDNGSGTGAQVMCEEFVKDRLKSPGSAEFESEDAVEKGRAWKVDGVVDSENAFGALLRNDYTCTVRYNPAEESWTLKNLKGLDN